MGTWWSPGPQTPGERNGARRPPERLAAVLLNLPLRSDNMLTPEDDGNPRSVRGSAVRGMRKRDATGRAWLPARRGALPTPRRAPPCGADRRWASSTPRSRWDLPRQQQRTPSLPHGPKPRFPSSRVKPDL